MPEPLIQVKVGDPSNRLVLIQARIKNLQIGDHSLFFKGPGIDTEPRNIRLYNKDGKTFEYVQSSDEKIFFRLDSPGDVFVAYEIEPGTIYSDKTKLLLLGGQSFFLYDLNGWNPADLTFDLPPGWGILTTAIRNPDGSYHLSDLRHGPFLLANLEAYFCLYESHLNFSDILLAVEKGSPYGCQQLAKFVSEYIQTMHWLLGGYPEKKMAVFFLQFPKEFKKIGYRGSAFSDTVYFFSGGLGEESAEFKKRVLWKFGHELFHVFSPQAFQPTDPQDFYWFWEGFSDYMALKIMAYNRLYDSESFLNACASVFNEYIRSPVRKSLSLIQASREFFASRDAEKLTYNKGFLVAFLMDLE